LIESSLTYDPRLQGCTEATDLTQNMIEGRLFIATHHLLCRSGKRSRDSRDSESSHGSYSQSWLVTAGAVVTAGTVVTTGAVVTASTVVTVDAVSGPAELALSKS
jgi:hypothetical protein